MMESDVREAQENGSQKRNIETVGCFKEFNDEHQIISHVEVQR